MEPATIDRIQQMIDDEATERFPASTAPRLVLLHHGDHPAIEPGQLYLQVVIDQDDAPWETWTQEQKDRIWDFREQRLPEARGVMVTTGSPDATGRRLTGIMMIDSSSLLRPDNYERARGLTPVVAHLGPEDLQTLDMLITAGIVGSRSESARWALARIREQPAYAKLSEQAREPGQLNARAALDPAAQDRLQTELDEQVKQRFPDGEVQRVALLQYGDDPWIEPGDLLVRVFIEEAEEEPQLPAWERDHEAVSLELHHEITAKVPQARYLEFWFGGDTGHQGQTRQRLRCPTDNPARPQRDLTVVDVRLGLADREMLDTLITAGIAASRAEAISWALARIRERPAYAKLSERGRELDDLKARF
jgi:Arc/MetJ-type ribon-helix-helix transcriptional regulator